MSLINICRDNTDVFYRYKMPPIQSKIEGKGNGIKTVVVNLADVARALARPPAYIIKYFGFELGANITMSEATDRYVVNGVHEAAKLQDTLDGFITKFVLCPSCKNPETEIQVKKNDTLVRECKACGKITDIDPRAKLSTYILKNPPKKIVKGTAAANVGGLKLGGEKEDTLEAVTIDAPSKQDEGWSVDMSVEAIARRAKNLSLDPGAAATLSEFEAFGEWMVSFEDKLKLPSDAEIWKKIQDMKLVGKNETAQILGQTLYDTNIVEQAGGHEDLLEKAVVSPEQQKYFLGGVERFFGLEHPDLVAQFPKVLFELYNNDIIDEDVVRSFCTKVLSKFVGDKKLLKKVRKTAKPFLQWLDTAEEESSDEE